MLDTNDLAAITEIVHGAFSDIPLKIVAGLNESAIQHIQLYASNNMWTLRIQRTGGAITMEWLDINNDLMARTVLRGI